MIRSTTFRTLATGLAASSLLVLAACGNDIKVATPPAVTTAAPSGTSGSTNAPGTTTASGGSTGATSPMGTVPSGGGSTADCLKFATAWATAVGSSVAGLETDPNVFDALVKTVPDSLKADAQVLAKAYSGYLQIIAKYKGDPTKAMTDPEAQKALQALGTPEVNAAQDKITKYFDDQCPKG